MNSQNFKKIFISITLTILGIGLFVFTPTIAEANGLVEINFEQNPLFQEDNFLPGQEITHWVEVTNKSEESQTIGVEVTNYSSCVENCLSDQLNLVISDEGANDLYAASLTDFFDAGEIELSGLGTGEKIKYYFSVTFLPESGNEYQNSEVSFDFKIGTLGKESISEEIPPGGGGGYFIPGLEIYNEDAEIEENVVMITWLTTRSATSRVIYSSEFEPHTLTLDNPPNYGYAHTTLEYDTSPKVTFHSVIITGLTPETTYYYRCVSRGSLAVSTEHSFTILGTAGEEEEEEQVPTEGETEEVEEEIPGEVAGEETEIITEEEAEETEEVEEELEEELEEEAVAEEEEEGAKMDLGKFLAAVGNFFNLENLCWLLILALAVLIALFYLTKKGIKKEDEKSWLFLLVVTLIAIIVSFSQNYCWFLLIPIILIIVLLILDRIKEEKKKKEGASF